MRDYCLTEKKSDGFLLFLKAFSWGTIWCVVISKNVLVRLLTEQILSKMLNFNEIALKSTYFENVYFFFTNICQKMDQVICFYMHVVAVSVGHKNSIDFKTIFNFLPVVNF